jgi:hypothetical protein
MPKRKKISWLLVTSLLAVGSSLLACGTRIDSRIPTGAPPAGLSVKRVRELLQTMGGANLTPEQVEIKSIAGGIGGDNAVVEARIETAFRLSRSSGDWQVAEVRLGDRQWESLELVENAVRHEKERRTAGLLKRLAESLEAYRREKGQFVPAQDMAVLLDYLVPRYLGDPLRFDWWGTQFSYRGTAQEYQLSSAGADRKAGTKDDLILENGTLRAIAE